MQGKSRSVIVGLLVVLIVLIGAVVYAVTSISQNNNVTINKVPAIGVATSTTDPTTCPVEGSTNYSTTAAGSNTVPWTITAGGNQTEWYCIENQGSGNDPSTTITLANGKPSGITCSETACLTLSTVPSPIPNLAAQSVSAPIAVTLTAVPDASGSGTAIITIA